MSFDDVRELYQDVILDRSRNPRHMHRLELFDANAARDNPMCGDQVEVRLCLGADGRVEEAAYEARGCAISLASADLMAEAVRGLTGADIRALANDFAKLARTGQAAATPGGLHVLAGVAEYPSRVKCATLPWTALVAALDSHRGKQHG